MPSAVLVDLDRTLIDLQSFTDYDSAWADVEALVPQAALRAVPETGWSSATRACMGLLTSLGEGELWTTVNSVVSFFERAAIAYSTPMPGAGEFVRALADRPCAVVTLLPEDVAREVLARHGIVIPVVIGRDPRIRPKPSGEGLLRALELLGSSPEGAVMVGDSTWDAAAAADAGVGFIGVHSPPGEFTALFPDVPSLESLADVLASLS